MADTPKTSTDEIKNTKGKGRRAAQKKNDDSHDKTVTKPKSRSRRAGHTADNEADTEKSLTHQVSTLISSLVTQNTNLEALPGVLESQTDSIKTMAASIQSLTNAICPSEDNMRYDELDQNFESGDSADPDQFSHYVTNPLVDDECDDNLPEAIIAILAQTNPVVDMGPKISQSIADSFSKIRSQDLHAESIERFKTLYKPPENCKELGVPKVNPEIWNSLPNTYKTGDAKTQHLQLNISRALVAQAKLADQLVQAKSKVPIDVFENILKPLMDSAQCLGLAMKEININRREKLKPALQSEFSALCSARVPVTELLFGDDIQQSIKNARNTSKIVRGSTFARRFVPYPMFGNRGRSPTSFRAPTNTLNFRSPQSFQMRGGRNLRFGARSGRMLNNHYNQRSH